MNDRKWALNRALELARRDEDAEQIVARAGAFLEFLNQGTGGASPDPNPTPPVSFEDCHWQYFVDEHDGSTEQPEILDPDQYPPDTYVRRFRRLSSLPGEVLWGEAHADWTSDPTRRANILGYVPVLFRQLPTWAQTVWSRRNTTR